MSLLRRAERVGLCPGRLVLAGGSVPHDGAPADALKELAGRSRMVVILSNHFARYAVLPWSAPLRSGDDWLSYARHTFSEVYGPSASGWNIRVSDAARRESRIACAVDAALLDSILGVSGVHSVQPYLMSAFNACRRALEGKTAWFVVQEPGRLALGLIERGQWRSIRLRQVPPQWQESLADNLDREGATLEHLDCEHAVLHAEEDVPARLGRYRIEGYSAPGADLMVRH